MRSQKTKQQAKVIILGLIFLGFIIFQSIFTLPNPALAVGNGASINQRATLPPEWTATFTLSAATAGMHTPLPTITLGGHGSTAVPTVTISTFNTGKKILIDVDFLALHTRPREDASIIEMAPRGSVKTILTDVKNASDNLTWYYVEDGYGWIPATLNGASTVLDYSPETLNQMIAETESRLKTDSQNITLMLQKGWMYYSQQEYDAAAWEISNAIDEMNAATDADPMTIAHLYDYRGHVYLDQGYYEDTAQDIDEAIILGLHEAAVYDRRAIAFQNMQYYEEARADYEDAIKLDPEYGLLYSNLGSLLDEMFNHNNDQLDYYTKAIEVDPYFPYAYSNRGNYYRLLGDVGDHVINDFTTALRLVPHDRSALLNRGVVYWLRQDREMALKDFSLLIQLYPNYGRAYSNRGAVYGEMGNTEAAITDLRMAIKIGDFSGLAYYNMGVVLEKQGQYTAALYCYNKALEINPYRDDAGINRSTLLDRMGNINEDQIMSYSSFELLITPTPS